MGKPVFNNGPRSLPENFPYYFTLNNLGFDKFLLADKSFPKALPSLKDCVLVHNNLCQKFVSSLDWPIKFDERFKVPSAPCYFYIFKKLSCVCSSNRIIWKW